MAIFVRPDGSAVDGPVLPPVWNPGRPTRRRGSRLRDDDLALWSDVAHHVLTHVGGLSAEDTRRVLRRAAATPPRTVRWRQSDFAALVRRHGLLRLVQNLIGTDDGGGV